MLLFGRYMGTITGISDLDPVRWKNSQWRNLQVGFLVIFVASCALSFSPFLLLMQIFFCDLRRIYFFNRLAGMSLQQAKGVTGFQSGKSNRLLLHFSYALHHFLVQNVLDN